MATPRTTVYLSNIDRRAIKEIQAHYGLATLSDAIRVAVRTLAQSVAGHNGDMAIRMEVALTTQAEIAANKIALADQQSEIAASQDELAQLREELQRTNAECQALVEQMVNLPSEESATLQGVAEEMLNTVSR